MERGSHRSNRNGSAGPAHARVWPRVRYPEPTPGRARQHGRSAVGPGYSRTRRVSGDSRRVTRLGPLGLALLSIARRSAFSLDVSTPTTSAHIDPFGARALSEVLVSPVPAMFRADF